MTYSEFEIETFLRTGEHEAELRLEFGDALYEELAGLARQMPVQGAQERLSRPVFILPGILGSRLGVVGNGQTDRVWIDPVDIAAGGLGKIAWGTDGGPVVATGTVLAPYMRMHLRLRLAGHDVRFLPYDWRRSPAETGVGLMRRIRREGLSGVTLVAHSMGGLVARAMAAEDPDGHVLSRIVTIGTPNHGSYSPVRIFDLTHSLLGPIALVDLTRTSRELVSDVLRHFPGLLQMMPDPAKRPGEPFFTVGFWPAGTERPLKKALEAAATALSELPGPDARFTQIVGFGEETPVAARIKDGRFLYTLDRGGDGTVPRDLAEMGDVKRLYVRGAHGGLCNRRDTIRATLDLIATGETDALPTQPPARAFEGILREVTAEALAPDRVSPPLAEIDFAGAFLGLGEDAGSPETAVIDTRPAAMSGPAKGVYPDDILRAAKARWDGTERERTRTEESRNRAQPLAAESPERIDLYARRLVTQVEAAGTNAQAAEISRELKTAIGRMDPAAPATRRPATDAFLERVIGEAEEFLSVMYIKRAVVAARAVGRIVDTRTGAGFGTGFLIGPGALMTNHHVLPDAAAAARASVQFRFELEIDSREMGGHVFTLDPSRLFVADEHLDMAVVAVVDPCPDDGTPLKDFGVLPLVGTLGKIRKGQPVNIVQHPLAGRKQVVFRESLLTALPEDADHVAHYSGDTQPGSSGSPVFSDRWEVVALHHSGVPDTSEDGRIRTVGGAPWDPVADPRMRSVKWVANEGIRVSRLVVHLEEVHRRLRDEGAPGAALLGQVLEIGRREVLFPPAAPKGPAPAPWQRNVPDPGRESQRQEDFDSGRSVTLPLRIRVDLGPFSAGPQGPEHD